MLWWLVEGGKRVGFLGFEKLFPWLLEGKKSMDL